MDHVQQLHDGGAVVGDGRLAPGVHHQLVHAPRAEGGADGIDDGAAGIDIGDDLLLALGVLCPVLQQENLGLGHFNSVRVNIVYEEKWGHDK